MRLLRCSSGKFFPRFFCPGGGWGRGGELAGRAGGFRSPRGGGDSPVDRKAQRAEGGGRDGRRRDPEAAGEEPPGSPRGGGAAGRAQGGGPGPRQGGARAGPGRRPRGNPGWGRAAAGGPSVPPASLSRENALQNLSGTLPSLEPQSRKGAPEQCTRPAGVQTERNGPQMRTPPFFKIEHDDHPH